METATKEALEEAELFLRKIRGELKPNSLKGKERKALIDYSKKNMEKSLRSKPQALSTTFPGLEGRQPENGNNVRRQLLQQRNELIDNVSITLNKSANELNSKSAPNLPSIEDNGESMENNLGIIILDSPKELCAPDGSFKVNLRSTIQNTLVESRFDSVATVLADSEWASHDYDLFMAKNDDSFTGSPSKSPKLLKSSTPTLVSKRVVTPTMAALTKSLDTSRKPFVSVLKVNDNQKSKSPTKKSTFPSVTSNNLTVCDIPFPGLIKDNGNDSSSPTKMMPESPDRTDKALSKQGESGELGAFDPLTMCFGCWSAGLKRKCSIHEEKNNKLTPAQSMLLCRNWDLGVMRRRYRSEEIQEIFLKKSSSLRYDAKRKRFSTVFEQRHPVYRLMTHLVNKYNQRLFKFVRVRQWLFSLADAVCVNKVGSKAAKKSLQLKMARSFVNQSYTLRYSRRVRQRLPRAPVTGTSFPEKTGILKHLIKHNDLSTHEEVDIMLAEPTPIPVRLYEPREYFLPVPVSIPMPSASSAGVYLPVSPQKNRINTIYEGKGNAAAERALVIADRAADVITTNMYINSENPASWLEQLSSTMCHQFVKNARMQISAITPMKGLELLRKTKQPPPSTIKFATLGRKPCPANTCIGGLAIEFLVYQLVNTYFPAQYGNLIATEQGVISPGVSPEAAINFLSAVSGPVVQPYLLRSVEHPLNYRKSPTITICSLIKPYDRHYYGLNNPQQTGEQEPHGFRTSAWTYHLYPLVETESLMFTPSPEIVSLNDTGCNRASNTHVDITYPFCEPSTKDNSTLDFYHLLLTGFVTSNKAQVFTALTTQEPGNFQRECIDTLPMGHMLVNVYRSWAFTQKDTIQEFKTDEGISYWYHHRTGQTYWERPLYEEEKISVLEGGLKVDTEHPEEPTVMHKGREGSERRYLQGDFRKFMLHHHENMKEAVKRRQSARLAVGEARARGVSLKGDNVSEIGMEIASKVVHSSDSVPPDGVLPPGGNRVPTMGNSSTLYATNGSGASVGDDSSINSSIASIGEVQQLYSNAKDIGALNSPGRMRNIKGSQLDESTSLVKGTLSPKPSHSQLPTMATIGTAESAILADSVPGIDPAMLMALSQAMGKMMSNMADVATPQEMLQMGLGMGVALMQSNTVKDMVVHTTTATHKKPVSMTHGDNHDNMSVGSAGSIPSNAEVLMVPSGSEFRTESFHAREPVGVPNPTMVTSSKRTLDHNEESQAKDKYKDLLNVPLTSYELVREVKVQQAMTVPPDELPAKTLTDYYSMSPDESLREKIPVLVYPELSTTIPGGVPRESVTHPAAGIGTSFVLQKNGGDKQYLVKGSDILRKAIVPLPAGFANAICAKHVASQYVDYLPQLPNLPQARTVGRVKGRSAAVDWLAVGFDPWSAGKNPLSVEFVPSLATKAEKLFKAAAGNEVRAMDELDAMKLALSAGSEIITQDTAGMMQDRALATKAQLLAADFKNVCSLARHNKYSEVEQLINQPDWSVPIDFQDEFGNALIHIAAQNGNKQLVKLCMRRGADLNIQNLNGNTALHFAFTYNHEELGNYMINKGANNLLRNKDNLTCYEGLSGKDLQGI